MPARRIPTEALEARGGYKGHADRKRARANEPKGIPKLGAAPGYFDEKQRAAWAEIADGAPAGVLTLSDRLSVELAARLLAELRAGTSKMQTSRIAELRKLFASFGFSPADRGSVSVAPAPKQSRLREALGDEEFFRLTRRS